METVVKKTLMSLCGLRTLLLRASESFYDSKQDNSLKGTPEDPAACPQPRSPSNSRCEKSAMVKAIAKSLSGVWLASVNSSAWVRLMRFSKYSF